MTGDWRRLALAALAAAAVAVACVTHSASAAPAKTTAKKAPAKEADAEQTADGEEAAAKKPAKKKQDPGRGAARHRSGPEAARGRQVGSAAQALTTVLSGGNLPPAIMAKALLYRGIAYRQQKKPAQAIADLTSALWLKGGLGEADRGDALKQRIVRLSGSGTGPGRRTDRSGRAERRACDAHGLRVRESRFARGSPLPRSNPAAGGPIRLPAGSAARRRPPSSPPAPRTGTVDHRIDRGISAGAWCRACDRNQVQRMGPQHRSARRPRARRDERRRWPSPKAGSASRSGWCARRPRRRRLRSG